MIKIFATAVVSFGLGVAVTYSVLSDNDRGIIATDFPQVVESPQNSNLPPPTNVHADYIRQLEELNRQLTKDLQAARGGQPQKTGKSTDELPPPVADAASFEEYYKARKNSEDFNQYLQSVSSGNGGGYVKDMAAKFETEAVDGQWASDYESRLYNLFDSDALAGKVVPQSVVCKSRRCQIKVAVANIDEANQAMQSFSEAINSNKLSIDKSMVVSAPDLDAGVVSLYVARDGNVKIHE